MKISKFTLKKPTKRQVSKFLLDCLFIIAGNACAAGAAALFIVPNGFVMGGTTGIGIFVRNLLVAYGNVSPVITEWAVNITVYVGNIILFVIGAVLLGKKFAVTTLAGTLLYPMFMTVFQIANKAYVGKYGAPMGMHGELASPLLAAMTGAILFGLGIAIVVRVGASTGGTDIPPLIFQKYFGLSVSVGLWLVDGTIVLLQLIAVDVTHVLYGLVITLLCSFVVDKVSPVGKKRYQVKVVSNQYLEIRDMILNKISRGVSILYGQTGYFKEDLHMLLTVVSAHQLVALKEEIERIDPEAFMTVSVVSEVHGRGFHTDGVDFLMPDDRDVNPPKPHNLPVQDGPTEGAAVIAQPAQPAQAPETPPAEEPHGED